MDDQSFWLGDHGRYLANKMRFTIRTLLVLIAISAVVILFLTNVTPRFPHGSSWVKDSNGTVAEIHWTRCAKGRDKDNGELIYAFTMHPELQYTETNQKDIDARINQAGVFRVSNTPDSIWINGKRLSLPEASKFFAIRADGTICPIQIPQKELEQICISSRTDDKLMKRKIMPAIYGNAK